MKIILPNFCMHVIHSRFFLNFSRKNEQTLILFDFVMYYAVNKTVKKPKKLTKFHFTWKISYNIPIHIHFTQFGKNSKQWIFISMCVKMDKKNLLFTNHFSYDSKSITNLYEMNCCCMKIKYFFLSYIWVCILESCRRQVFLCS